MIFSYIIFLIAATFSWPNTHAQDSDEYTDNLLSMPQFEEIKLYTRFLIDNAPVTVKSMLEKQFQTAFTTKWTDKIDFEKFMSGFVDELEDKLYTSRQRSEQSRSKRASGYCSEDFYKAIYSLYVILNANEEDRPWLKEKLVEAQKMDWSSLEEFKNYSDDLVRKIAKQHEDELDA